MGLPRPTEARLYYRAAKQRYAHAQWLLDGERTTGPVYLAGYTVECFLNSLLLASLDSRLRNQLLGEFRGNRGHNIEWLGRLYRRHVGITIPGAITRHLSRVASWSTDLRYGTGTVNQKEADEFFESVNAIAAWAEGRM